MDFLYSPCLNSESASALYISKVPFGPSDSSPSYILQFVYFQHLIRNTLSYPLPVCKFTIETLRMVGHDLINSRALSQNFILMLKRKNDFIN